LRVAFGVQRWWGTNKELPMRYSIAFVVLLAGCVGMFGESTSRIEGEETEEEDPDNDDCKIEDDSIGQEGVTILLGSRTATFSNWVLKDGEDEYVGFTVTLSDGSAPSYVVKAGGELHESTATTWIHPNGPSGGASTPGISNVDMCDDDGGDGGGGDDGGGDGGGTEPPLT
jgi:hypothetical protein